VDIGKMRHEIVIQQKPTTKNSFGETLNTWDNVCTIWASIEPLQGREYFSAEQIQSEVTTRIRIRYIDGIKPNMRVKYGDSIFNIKSIINPKYLNVELQLMCTEVF